MASATYRKFARILSSGIVITLVVGFTVSLSQAEEPVIKVPLGLPPIEFPEDNPPTAEKIALGKQLYFDKRLSRDNTISCASCHSPVKGYSNADQFATGFKGQKGGRNSPTVINAAYNKFHFWDGRAGSLEEQALGPIANPIEMNLTTKEAVDRINAIPGYKKQFQKIFGSDATEENIAKAIATYERTILCGDAPYDRFKAGDKKALSESAQRGMQLFFGKAACSSCHSGPTFTDHAFHNIGVGMDAKEPDAGRKAISNLGGDHGSFKTPTVRDIARSAPYMHDGSLKTLKEVVEHYNKGGIPNEFLDEEIFKLNLTPQEVDDLVTFMKEGLSSSNYPEHKEPELP
ncbi:MAG: cytochrome-c peroxidase [Gimesia sp.]|jgi:cytochrome c peroxidase|uniref:Methylamine utilization protein MauG n=1 Tax=Gimesia maris TaxID=122 RepID=A0A3D3R0R4_9PLAN|nr:cytochrome-c peroxidase [Gimesia sp.]HCO22423.1 cytochrome-c peroxidase [Gimesia maris]|tara:strand:- start:16355 stop:17392 length:1038 start_codon:yes stop_codon:yes gene_type:complete